MNTYTGRGPLDFSRIEGRPSSVHPFTSRIEIDRGKNGGSRDSPRGRGPRYRRGGRACTRSRVLVSGATCVIRHWRQGRDRAGGCAQGRLPLYYGDSGRVHTVLPRESKSPRVSAARTHGTHTQQGRPRPASRVLPPPPPQSSYFPGPWAPFTPTAPPRSATNRYHSNRKISQWTRTLHDSPFPSIFFFFFQRVACFVLLLFLLFSFSIFERRRWSSVVAPFDRDSPTLRFRFGFEAGFERGK